MLRGLRDLAALSLDHTPAAEVMPTTAAVWCEAIAHGRDLDESDAPRIDAAFRRIKATALRWPAPAELIAAIPARRPPDLAALPRRAETDDDRQRNLDRLRDMFASAGIIPPTSERPQ